MKKAIFSILMTMILLVLPACGADSQQADGAASLTDGSSYEAEAERSSDSYSPVSMNRFKSAVAEFGEAQDVSEDFGFDACMAVGADGTDYIYMYLTSEEMAQKLITDGDGDGYQDPGLKMIRAGANYEFYREVYENDEADTTICGFYLRVDNMLILVTGDQSMEDTVKANADTLFRSLGYEMTR